MFTAETDTRPSSESPFFLAKFGSISVHECSLPSLHGLASRLCLDILKVAEKKVCKNVAAAAMDNGPTAAVPWLRIYV